MFFKRSPENPILVPKPEFPWEAEGAFNGCAIRRGGVTHLVYRAQSLPHLHEDGFWLSVSSIGHATSKDGIHFGKHTQFIEPTEKWERYGCEDPRVTYMQGKYYIFYTALSTYPFGPDGIKVAVAISKDLKTISEKHPVTPFNAKAAALFPEKIDGKYWMILTANTDISPAKIALRGFDAIEDMWDQESWMKWYDELDRHTLPLQRDEKDYIEVGAAPIQTTAGWIVLYSYIKNYKTDRPIFSIEAVLLDHKNPQKILGRTGMPLMAPKAEYELYGKVPNIVFPSGAFVWRDKIHLYYGAADTTTCTAVGDARALKRELFTPPKSRPALKRYEKNPILKPVRSHDWEEKAVFNPAAIHLNGKTRLFYRAMSEKDTSYFGYAETNNGFDISYRRPGPAYIPREFFEGKAAPGNSGCEDARLTEIDGKIYMLYTAVDAANPPRVAMTSIEKKHFLGKKFDRFDLPILISPEGIDDKDACLLPEKIGGRYVILHRIQPDIDINFFDTLEDLGDGEMLYHQPFIFPRKGMWDSKKVGISSTPIKTDRGWLLLYHGVSDDGVYRVGVVLLDLKHPDTVLARSRYPLFEPERKYEKEGIVPNVVFPCGSVVRGGKLFVYYGAADKVAGVATMSTKDLYEHLDTFCE